MNRYPVWKYAIIVIALLVGMVYTLPNFFGEAPAVQVSTSKSTIKVDDATLQKVKAVLQAASLPTDHLALEGNSVRVRFDTPDDQLKAKDVIQRLWRQKPAASLEKRQGFASGPHTMSRSPVAAAVAMGCHSSHLT